MFGFPLLAEVREFTGKVITEMSDLVGVMKIQTLPYHSQSNGSVKHVHQMLRRMIAKLDPEKREKWPSHLRLIIVAYNVTRSLVTGYLPYFLMFRHRLRLPVDLLFLTARQQEIT